MMPPQTEVVSLPMHANWPRLFKQNICLERLVSQCSHKLTNCVEYTLRKYHERIAHGAQCRSAHLNYNQSSFTEKYILPLLPLTGLLTAIIGVNNPEFFYLSLVSSGWQLGVASWIFLKNGSPLYSLYRTHLALANDLWELPRGFKRVAAVDTTKSHFKFYKELHRYVDYAAGYMGVIPDCYAPDLTLQTVFSRLLKSCEQSAKAKLQGFINQIDCPEQREINFDELNITTRFSEISENAQKFWRGLHAYLADIIYGLAKIRLQADPALNQQLCLHSAPTMSLAT